MTHTVNCQNPTCSKSFIPKNGSLGKYCSLSCGTAHRNKRNKEATLITYNASPSYCQHCNKQLPYEIRHQLFCSRSCRTIHNNALRPKKIKQDPLQIKLENDLIKFNSGIISCRPTIRKMLATTVGYCCSICKLSTWNNTNITLIVDHIDGNAGNNFPNNLRLLCPNCNSQTPTFGGRNKGNGRKARGLPLN